MLIAETALQDHHPRDKPGDGCLPDRVSDCAVLAIPHRHDAACLRGRASPQMLALCRTILELVRDMATDLVADGACVKVCVQQALGQGVFQVRARTTAAHLV